MSETCHYFIPAVRQGLTAKIAGEADGQRAMLDVILTATAARMGTGDIDKAYPSQSIALYGPGDILGFDERIVVRTTPKPNIGDFETYYFPAIEFADPDFTCRITANRADATGNLTPWITILVLVAEDKGETIKMEFKDRVRSDDSLPRFIEITSPAALPDLGKARRWAHVHITAEKGLDETDLTDILRREPEHAVCRLMCARRLAPGVKYNAFVVPTFKLGVLAGLGLSLGDTKATNLAWEKNDADGSITVDAQLKTPEGNIRLPYYYRWEFRTGLMGDFEQLVRLLEPRKLTGLGLRDMDCSKPGFDTSGVLRPGVEEKFKNILEMEGALQSLDTEYTDWPCGKTDMLGIKSTQTIKNIELYSEDASTVRVRWNTETPASSQLYYGESSEYGDPIVNNDPKTKHDFVLEGLTPGKTYHIKITARMVDGTVHETPDGIFSLFQLELARLLNRPNTEDLARESRNFEFHVVETESISSINGNPTPLGSEATIEWHTAVPRTTRIEYWETGKNPYPPVEESGFRTDHKATLPRLIPERIYRFKISGTNEQGNTEEAPAGWFKILLPVVVPPVYGRWHRGKLKDDGRLVDPCDQSGWIDTLNLDPRHRAAAGLGAEVIRKQQEPLMASAWEQLGAIEKANDILRRAQLGRDSSTSIHSRLDTLKSANPDAFIRITSAAHNVIILPENDNVEKLTATAYLGQKTRILPAAVDPAFRRIAAPRRVIGRRQKLYLKAGTPRGDIIRKLAEGTLEAAGPARQPLGTPRILEVTRKLRDELSRSDVPRTPAGGGGPIAGESIEKRNQGLNFDDQRIKSETVKTALKQKPFEGIPALEDLAEVVGPIVAETMTNWLDKDSPQTKETKETKEKRFITDMCESIFADLSPNKTILQRTKRRLRHVGVIQKRFADGATGDPLDPIMWAPEFDYPMYEPLRDLGHSTLLPGVEKIPQNTVALLKPNHRFQEAYHCGLIHEFAGELLWRCFPTDQRGSYFRQFWDVSEYVRRQEEEDRLLGKWLSDKGQEDKTIYNDVGDLPESEKMYLLARKPHITMEGLQGWIDDEAVPGKGDFSDELKNWVEGLIKGVDEDGVSALAELTDSDVTFNSLVRYVLVEECFAEYLRDIKELTKWGGSPLGENGTPGGAGLVLVIRGNLLQRYPNALIYAVAACNKDGKFVPALEEYVDNPPDRIFPVFRATLPTDLTFFGFPFDKDKAGGDPGMFFVIEEHPGEPRFGADMPSDLQPGEALPLLKWDDLSWSHFGYGVKENNLFYGTYLDNPPDISQMPGDKKNDWVNASSANIAKFTWQKPVRVAIHASQMLP